MAQMTYFKAFSDYLINIEPLDDAAKGRLFAACLTYCQTGIVPEFTGNERFVFPAIKKDIDREREILENESKKNSENGKQGGAPIGNQNARKNKTTENNPKQPKTTQTSKTSQEQEQEQEQEYIFDKSNDLSCAEPRFSEASAPAKTETKTVISLPLKGKHREFNVTQEQIKQWAELYPAANITQELRNMKGWLQGNPTRQKTKSGILRFINSWLAKEQNRGSLTSEQEDKQPDEQYIKQVREYLSKKKQADLTVNTC